MKSARHVLIIGLALFLVILFILIVKGFEIAAQDPNGDGTDAEGPTVGEPVKPGVSDSVRNLPTAEPRQPGDPVYEINPRQQPGNRGSGPIDRESQATEPADQNSDRPCPLTGGPKDNK